MATKNIGLSLPPYNAPNWNVPLNTNSEIIDSTFGNSLPVSITPTGYTLSAKEVQNMRIAVTGNIGAAQSALVFPQGIGGMWIVSNYTTGGGRLIARSYSYTTTPITIPLGKSCLIFSDGANIYSAVDGYFTDVLTSEGGTITEDLTVDKELEVNGPAAFGKSIRIFQEDGLEAEISGSSDGNYVGFSLHAGSPVCSAMDLICGKWIGNGGLGIGQNDPAYADLKNYCPPAARRDPDGAETMQNVDVGIMLTALFQEVQALKKALAVVTTGKKP